MRPKHGILHDYDLQANLESAARKTDFVCVICETQMPGFQWSDFSGEAMCRVCGCPYQLKWGSPEQEAEGNYPYLNLRPELVPIVKEYWAETHRWTCLGRMLDSRRPGLAEFITWCRQHCPDASRWVV